MDNVQPDHCGQVGRTNEGGAMQYSTTTDALLQAIKCDVKFRIDKIVDEAELAAMNLESEEHIDAVLEQALLYVENALAEAAHAMAREIHRERAR
jgi:hypothetical protein